MSDSSEPRGLYLLAPRQRAVGEMASLLTTALHGGGIACVAIDDAGVGSSELERAIAACQSAGAAAIVMNAVAPGGEGADGVHLHHPGSDDDQVFFDQVRRARIAQGRNGQAGGQASGIVGAGALRTRHQAMSAGELEVDYVMFGEPGVDASVPPPEAVLDRVRWWAEIFTVPCVAYAQTLDDVGALAEAGADFIAVGDAVWNDPRGPRAAIDDVLVLMAGQVVEAS